MIIRTKGLLDFEAKPEDKYLVVQPYYFPKGFKAKPGMKSLDRVKTVREHYETQPVLIPAKNIALGDYLIQEKPVYPVESKTVEWVYESKSSIAKPVIKLYNSADISWMIGFYVADGGTMGTSSISFAMSLKDDVNRMVRVWKTLGLEAKTVDLRKSKTCPQNMHRVIINSKTVSISFREWFGKGTKKKLPDWVFTHGFDLKSMVEGYTQGDGYIHRKGTVTAHTISPTLLEQLRLSLISIGYSPTVSPVRRWSGSANPNPAWKIQWRPDATQHQTAWWNGYYLVPVTGIFDEEPESKPIEYKVREISNKEIFV